MAKATVAGTAGQQISVLQALSQESAAFLLGVTSRALRDHGGSAPRNSDGTYPGQQLVEWHRGRMPATDLSDGEIEKCLQVGDMLAEPGDADVIVDFINGLRDQYGDAGLIAFWDLFQQAFSGQIKMDRDRRAKQLPSLEEWLKDAKAAKDEFERQVTREAERRNLNHIVWCSCGRRRLGRKWVQAPKPNAAQLVLDLCQTCHSKVKDTRPRTGRSR